MAGGHQPQMWVEMKASQLIRWLYRWHRLSHVLIILDESTSGAHFVATLTLYFSTLMMLAQVHTHSLKYTFVFLLFTSKPVGTGTFNGKSSGSFNEFLLYPAGWCPYVSLVQVKVSSC